MIKKISIKNFQAHELFITENLTPLNLIIGANDTGKTSLLKILYATCKSWKEYGLKQKHNPEPFKNILIRKLQNTFNPKNQHIGYLAKKNTTAEKSKKLEHTRKNNQLGLFSNNSKKISNEKSNDSKKLNIEISFEYENQNINFNFGDKASKTLSCNKNILVPDKKFGALFIPAKELITMLHAIEASRDNLFFPDFDDSYYDLVKSLKIPTRRGRINKNLNKVNSKLEKLFGGEVKQNIKDSSVNYIFQRGNQKFTMSLTAEGIKKNGILTTLIRNRELSEGTILFMDEPDATLHPNATRQLAEMIYFISKAGIQIFIATHNYFMLKQLSIIARREKDDINCFSLKRSTDNKKVIHTLSNLIDGLPENTIVEEALKMFDDETELDFR